MTVGGSPELSPEEEKWRIRDISAVSEARGKAGDTFYLITQRWWREWLLFVNQNQRVTNDGSSSHQPDSVGLNLKRPSQINNSDLVSGADSENSTIGIKLLDALVEGTHYILLPEEIWDQLYSWYGGGPTLARKVIGSGEAELAVEVYPLRLHLHLMPKDENSTIRISKKETVGDLQKRARDIFSLTSEQVSIWDYFGKRRHALMNDLRKTLDDANIQMDQDILVEVVSNIQENGCADQETMSIVDGPPDSSFSVVDLSISRGVSRNNNAGSSQSQIPTPRGRVSDNVYGISGMTTRGSPSGLTGLKNLGNTCFMNSAIQCLVHTPEFARYFLDDFHKEINRKNNFGMMGMLAVAFGDLLRKLWAPGRSPVDPCRFKAKLEKFAEQFRGYNQHDSQELLAFLLDGLHEDLNRVKHGPYRISRDADGRPDEEVANEYWSNHVARNDSIIVDVCQGQYKSTLVCSVCSKVSVTFDPFMYLSLPLPCTVSRNMTVTVFSCDGSAKPNTCLVAVPKQGHCRDLTQAISYACSLKPNEKLVLAEVRNHQIDRFLEDPLFSLSSVKDDAQLAAYKIPKLLKNVKYLQLIHFREQATGHSHKKGEWKPFGTPIISPISCNESITSGEIQSMVHAMLSPMPRTGNMGHLDITDSNNSLLVLNQSGTTTSVEAGRKSNAAGSLRKDSGSSKSAVSKKLPLKLVDENDLLVDIAVGEDKVIKLSSTSMLVKVIMDWSDKLLKYYDISYLESLPEVFKYGPVVKKGRPEPTPISLYTCLEAFLREEPLVPDEMWKCPDCKEQRQASKKLDLWRLPEVLVIHLKRFSYNTHRSTKHKLETFVDFPIHNLDLTNYVANKKNPRRELYELYALTNHYGGMGSGHYDAHIKLLDENWWYNFDDSNVTPINEENVKSAAAYVLFYKRVKMDDAYVSNGAFSSAGHNVPSHR